jgi:hypothetical protein
MSAHFRFFESFLRLWRFQSRGRLQAYLAQDGSTFFPSTVGSLNSKESPIVSPQAHRERIIAEVRKRKDSSVALSGLRPNIDTKH